MDDAPRRAALPEWLVLRLLPALRRGVALLRAPWRLALVPRVRLGAAARARHAAGADS